MTGRIHYLLLCLPLLLAACGGKSSSDKVEAIPVDVALESVALSAGTPTTVRYTIPAPPTPYTAVRIDLRKTLEAARITVTPTP